MKLIEVEIRNFRSISAAKIRLTPETTVLIGMNEAGKSNVLYATSHLRPEKKFAPEDARLESELGADVLRSKMDSPTLTNLVVKGTFRLDPNDRSILFKIFQDNSFEVDKVDIDQLESLEVSKNFKNDYDLHFIPNFTLKHPISTLLNEYGVKILDRVINQPFEARFDPLREKLDQTISSINEISVAELSTILRSIINETRTLISQLGTQAPLDDMLRDATKIESKLAALGNISEKDLLLNLLPNIVYVHAWDLLQDSVGLQELKSNPKPHSTMLNLLKLGEVQLDVLERVTDSQRRIQLLNQAAEMISRTLQKTWTQEHIILHLSIEQNIIYVNLKDAKSGELVPPSQRSPGVQSFLAFYINYAAGAKGSLSNSILLLDDAGTYLHPSGQRDLLSLIEEYGQNIQVVFTTHYAPLIDIKQLGRVRIVERGLEGSVVIENFRSIPTNNDALEPVRRAIGATLGDSLAFSRDNILVEGTSDMTILQTLLEEILEEPYEKNYAVWPAGGASKIYPYAFFLWKEDLDVIVLLDNDPKGREAREELLKHGFPSRQIITTADLLGDNQKDGTIEDIFESSMITKAFESYIKEFGLEIEAITTLERPFLPKLTKAVKKIQKKLDKPRLAAYLLEAFASESKEVKDHVFTHLQPLITFITKKPEKNNSKLEDSQNQE